MTPAAAEASRVHAGSVLFPSDTFAHRHIGPSPADIDAMLGAIGCSSLVQLMDETVPSAIRLRRPLKIEPDAGRPLGESEVLDRLKAMAGRNKVLKSHIGMGYFGTITPGVILRNILENPGWYTQYTPYQAEISQGRLEALLNFQTMVSDLTGLPLAGASLLDEGTAAAEAMAMCHNHDDARRRHRPLERRELFERTDADIMIEPVHFGRIARDALRAHLEDKDALTILGRARLHNPPRHEHGAHERGNRHDDDGQAGGDIVRPAFS
ncbi:MAG: hypothetical protein HUU21_17720 [Polyangiaceae bacterium]|nr:hypothetical protein [Polyangiaceae bacterium]